MLFMWNVKSIKNFFKKISVTISLKDSVKNYRKTLYNKLRRAFMTSWVYIKRGLSSSRPLSVALLVQRYGGIFLLNWIQSNLWIFRVTHSWFLFISFVFTENSPQDESQGKKTNRYLDFNDRCVFIQNAAC